MKKVIFCGFGELGKECMKAILGEGYQIYYVMTHKENQANSVDTFAQNEGIKYSYVDARKNLEQLAKHIRSINPDFLISVNYRYIIPKEIFTLANFALNIHGSLLPKYRGRTPHVWSIINGETKSGITCHLVEESVDTGDIILQKVIPIVPEETGYSLLKKFESEYPMILLDSLDRLINGSTLTKQDEKFASYYGKRTPDMGYIDFRKKASEVIDFVRSQAEPYPGAYYYLLDGRKIIINKLATSEITNFNVEIGVIKMKDNDYYVRCKDGTLVLEDYRIIE